VSTAEMLERLRQLGYTVTLDGPDIKLRYPRGQAQPPEARRLIEELRERKSEAVSILRGADDKTVGRRADRRGDGSGGPGLADVRRRGRKDPRPGF